MTMGSSEEVLLNLFSSDGFVFYKLAEISWHFISEWYLCITLACFSGILMCAIVFILCLLMSVVYELIQPANKIQNEEELGKLRKYISLLWYSVSRVWHGYEVIGSDNIPQGAGIIVWYHGALPIDIYYIVGYYYHFMQRRIRTAGATFLFKLFGRSIVLEAMAVTDCSKRDTLLKYLENGEIIAIAPGGVDESQLGDHNPYEPMWGTRTGFAKLAIEAKCPIIPMFTVNIRQAFRTIPIISHILAKVYERTKLPVIPIIGGLPVKLITILGRPIEYDPQLTPEELAEKTRQAIKQLIKQHQHVPASSINALRARFNSPKKDPNNNY